MTAPLCWPECNGITAPMVSATLASVPSTAPMLIRIAAEIRASIAVTDLQAEALAYRILAAMRNPTEAMSEAAWSYGGLTPEDMWPTMIDAALTGR